MPDILHPETPEELRDALLGAADARLAIEVFGSNTKRLMAGPVKPADTLISTTRLNRIVQYEPKDLTVGVEAGMPFAELSRELARNGQMVPLEGPYSDSATVGGMIAANISGSRRRGYGTARDLVIGMKFVTLDGNIVQSGGMVVKNVAGLDMAKLLIGSFGTLAAIASVNFKLVPIPAAASTLLFSFGEAKTAVEAANAAVRGVLNPVAVDIVNPALAERLGLHGFVLALAFAGNDATIERANREASGLGLSIPLAGADEWRFWESLRQVTPGHLENRLDGAVGRVSTTLADCGDALSSVGGPGHAHAASGIVRGWFETGEAASQWVSAGVKRGWKGVVEFSSEPSKSEIALWPAPGGDFAIMKQIKHMFDKEGLLNSGRLYGLL